MRIRGLLRAHTFPQHIRLSGDPWKENIDNLSPALIWLMRRCLTIQHPALLDAFHTESPGEFDLCTGLSGVIDIAQGSENPAFGLGFVPQSQMDCLGTHKIA